jgi:biotin transport system substrate-specific component
MGPYSFKLNADLDFSFQSVWILLLPLLFGLRGTIAVAVYLIIGALGAPVFSGYSSGWTKFYGVTGGFLFGFLICAVLIQLFAHQKNGNLTFQRILIILLTGHIALLILGFSWMIFTGVPPTKIPDIILSLLPGLLIKIIVGAFIYRFTMKALKRSIFN